MGFRVLVLVGGQCSHPPGPPLPPALSRSPDKDSPFHLGALSWLVTSFHLGSLTWLVLGQPQGSAGRLQMEARGCCKILQSRMGHQLPTSCLASHSDSKSGPPWFPPCAQVRPRYI